MGTQTQQKRTAGKPEGRKFAAKIARAAKKTGKALGALLGGGIIATSFAIKDAPAQAPSAQMPKGKAEITMAARAQGLPANTYAAPDTLPRSDRMSPGGGARMAENAKGGAKAETGADPGQKWCDGIEIENGQLIFKGMEKNGRRGDAYLDIKNLLYRYVLEGATTDNIKWQETRTINGKRLVGMVIETPDNSVLFAFNPDFEANDAWGKGTFAKDEQICPKDKAKYIAADGTVFAATPTTILIIPAGESGKRIWLTLSKLIDGDAPPMQQPEIYEEAGWFVIKDPVMKNSKGEQMKVIFKIFPGEDKFESAIIPENARP